MEDTEKKIVVTGASGYLGARLCRALIARGFAVRALVRHSSDISELPTYSGGGDACVELAYGDINDYQSLLAAFSGCQVVFHVAALVGAWLPNPSKWILVNVEGFKNVLQAVKATKTIEKIVYTSSFFALGPSDGFVGDENLVHKEDFFCSEYERSKVIAAKIACTAASEGLPLVMVYPGYIYGPGKITMGNSIAKLMIERFSGRMPGYMGRNLNKLAFCHVDDVVEGHIAAMKKGRPGEKYIFTGENASLKHVFDLAAAITGTSKPKFCIPLVVIDVYAWIEVLIYRLTGRLPLVSPPVVEIMRHEWAYTCEKAKRELGYNPRSLQDGLSEMLQWLKDLKLINY